MSRNSILDIEYFLIGHIHQFALLFCKNRHQVYKSAMKERATTPVHCNNACREYGEVIVVVLVATQSKSFKQNVSAQKIYVWARVSHRNTTTTCAKTTLFLSAQNRSLIKHRKTQLNVGSCNVCKFFSVHC